MDGDIQKEVSAMQTPTSTGRPDIDNLQSQINGLSQLISQLQYEINAAIASLQSHQHTGIDSSAQTEGKPDLKASTLQLSGGTIVGSSVSTLPLAIYDNVNDFSSAKRSVGMGIEISGARGSLVESDELSLSVGIDASSLQDQFDFTKFNISNLIVIHEPNNKNTPPYSFFVGLRTPRFVSPLATGKIIQAGTLLTDTSAAFHQGTLIGCRINIYGADGSLLEGHVVVSNTSTTLSVNGPWISSSGSYSYEIYVPMFLGSPNNPWRSIYVDNEGGRAIRFGQGPSSGTQYAGIYYGHGNPNSIVSANPGSIYLNLDGATGPANTLWVKESGTIGSSGEKTNWIVK